MSVVLPWYERDAAGVWTGREWATGTEAHAQVAAGCSVHVEIAARVGPVSWAPSRWVGHEPRVVREWKPRGFGGAD